MEIDAPFLEEQFSLGSVLPLLSPGELKIAQPYGFHSTLSECLHLSCLPADSLTKASTCQTVPVRDLCSHGPGQGCECGVSVAVVPGHSVTGLGCWGPVAAGWSGGECVGCGIPQTCLRSWLHSRTSVPPPWKRGSTSLQFAVKCI